MAKSQNAADRKKARAQFLKLMEQYGATPLKRQNLENYDAQHLSHAIERRGCTLDVSYIEGDSGDWIACKWRDAMDKVNAAALPFHNSFSGKWNHMAPRGTESVALFEVSMERAGLDK